MGVEAGFAGRHGNILGMGKADKNLQMEDAVHRAARAFNGSLERIHCPDHVLLKWVRHENVIVSGVAVIRTGAGEVIDAVMYVIGAARLISAGRAGLWRRPG